MNTLLKKITLGLLALFILAVGGVGMQRIQTQNAVAANFYAVQTQATTLYQGISSSATSARLRSFNDIYGNKLTMTMFGAIGYVTFEPGISGKEEVASFTGITDNGDGTQTITGLTRGLYSRFPFGAGGTARSHGSNTYVVVSNAGEFYNRFAIKQNDEAITGLWSFNSYLPTSSITATSGSQFVTKTYVDGGLLAGAATGTESTTGIVRLSTKLQQASSTPSTSNTPLVIQAQNATSTYNAGAAGGNGLNAVITRNDNTIDPNFISTSSPYIWGGASTFNASTTFSGRNTFGTATSTFNATTTFTGFVSGANKFGGDGSDGALNISSGTTTLDFGSARVLEKNYTSVDITGTASLVGTTTHSTGGILYIRSQGNCNITSTGIAVDVKLSGATGGAAVISTANTSGNTGTASRTTTDRTNGAGERGLGGASSADVSSGGVASGIAGSVSPVFEFYRVSPGAGGGSGGTGSLTASSGVGGRGGGAVILECAGGYNFTSTISAAAQAGGNGGGQAGGGGGGAGGDIQVVYGWLIADSGTYTVSGGTGGTKGTAGTTNNGAGGSGGSSTETSGSNGLAGSTSGGDPGNGGAGAAGTSNRVKNKYF